MARKPKQPETLTDQLRRFLESSGESMYAIAEATGIDKSALSRFLSGERGVSAKALDKLGEHLGLELRRRPAKGR